MNCTIANNNNGNGFGFNDSPIEVINCIEWNNDDNWGDLSHVSYSLIAGGLDGEAPGTGVLGDSHPMFVDSQNGDYHLQLGSPCIDSGDPGSAYNDVNGTRNDMGYYGGSNGESYVYVDGPPVIDTSEIEIEPSCVEPGEKVKIGDVEVGGATTVVARIESPDGNVITTVPMVFDEDEYEVEWQTTAGIERHYFVDIIATDAGGNSSTNNNAAEFDTHFPVTIHVDGSNVSGIEDGSVANPYSTITDAVAIALGGDTVLVHDGVYIELVVINDDITLRSENGYASTTVIRPASAPMSDVAVVIVEGCESVIVEGFTLSTGLDNDDNAGIWVGDSGVCYILNNYVYGSGLGIGVGDDSEECTVRGNICVST